MPVINNIIGDTSEFVNKYNVGINVDDNSILDFDRLKKMRMDNENGDINKWRKNFVK